MSTAAHGHADMNPFMFEPLMALCYCYYYYYYSCYYYYYYYSLLDSGQVIIRLSINVNQTKHGGSDCPSPSMQSLDHAR